MTVIKIKEPQRGYINIAKGNALGLGLLLTYIFRVIWTTDFEGHKMLRRQKYSEAKLLPT
ncbi:MAG: hypothetical protein DRR08_07770 [Candidatus Parabeggiatoa sp. nov. 2]|nr:MAG: hypothetical protein B6247_22630 [Beggiatoa sp. 4572_84]RKZ61826.1 MAG: hypothetical protein DRR08_07770 [Gammaproteobacteria bacterium]